MSRGPRGWGFTLKIDDAQLPATEQAQPENGAASKSTAVIARLGAKPNMCWLPKKSLKIDRRYQRQINSRASKKLIDRLKESFCWTHCAPLSVSDNSDGTYTIIDGQHRKTAADAIPEITLLPCLVHDALSLKEQAHAFVAHNQDRVQVGPLAIFAAKAAAGDPVALGLQKACHNAGVVIPRGHRKASDCKPNETAALGVLTEIYKEYDAAVAVETVTAVLKVIVAAYPQRTGQLSSFMIRAVWKALETWEAETIISALQQTHDADLQLEARFAAAADPDTKIRDAYVDALMAKIGKVTTPAAPEKNAAKPEAFSRGTGVEPRSPHACATPGCALTKQPGIDLCAKCNSKRLTAIPRRNGGSSDARRALAG